MIRHIIRKEILENLLSLRFMLSLILIISLFAASGFIFVGKYRLESGDYWKKTNKNLESLREQPSQLYKLAFYQNKVYRKPNPLNLCVDGFEKALPNYFKFNVFKTDLPEIKGQSNFILPHFSAIDWVFIISLVLSFVALAFTYNSICGEKEAGTLRLMLAGSIPRYKVLIAKYFGVMLTLGIPLFIGLLVSLIIVITSNVTVISGLDWLKIATIVFLSFLYLSIFVLLGIFVSSRTPNSANCMVILLLVWVGLVILIPSCGGIISDLLCKSPTPEEFHQKLTEAHSQIDSKMMSGIYGEDAGRRTPNADECNPPGRARYSNAETNAENRVIEEYHNRMLSQAFNGRNFTCMSPTILYQRASEAIVGTGINRCRNLYQQIKRYQANLKKYILAEDSQDNDSLHLLFDEENSIVEWNAISKKAVDFDTVPKFQEQDLALGESLQLAIWDIGLLALFNLVFFAAAFVSFLRYDVR